jgi:hypothetical protein
MKIVVIILICSGIQVISQNNQLLLPFPSIFGGIFFSGSHSKTFFPSLFDDKPNKGNWNILQYFPSYSFFPSSFSQIKYSVKVQTVTLTLCLTLTLCPNDGTTSNYRHHHISIWDVDYSIPTTPHASSLNVSEVMI